MFDALPANLKPVGRGKVNGLRHVVAVVEAGVVGPGERNNKLPGILVHSA